ncbi:hypothetical protein [Desulfonema magnum]|uniref:Uncharacterized protein n=1 Tax=Desulfonema magnum TaxID=45655 RepID=A0A975BNZ1_9BACT|nr:hypothetical protein [Desulfonema magnum]QTA88971.1 Uncharacterized protein dnm_050160 [Desulfonema magnum]
MEAIRQKVKIPKNREILIKVPQHIPENGTAEVIILMNKETKQSKLDKLKDAMQDSHFLNDLNEISEDFKAIDIA